MANRGSFFLVVAALAAVAAGCGEEPVPAMPSFATDVKPLTLSRCVRCHGAGGTLNADPDAVLSTAPLNGFFDHPDVAVPNCTVGQAANPSPCNGLGYYAVGQAGNGRFNLYFPMMPPAPGASLTDRERQIIKNWIANPLP